MCGLVIREQFIIISSAMLMGTMAGAIYAIYGDAHWTAPQ